ncbi:two component transcriptional regulator, LytTR family [Cnuella takakiae]|uniref:Two component transcriptional regulator, LytTR family n=1 Tax=Cnuella takakiae TaxID=1302690 RepID=A0A1M5GT12_9BACT|nr:LytTR family DNA-binding domain-containing protein [Cnuella takakiae]OLY90902.1 DNA-binding response regulator [Cnuella takakiae]SHG06758.1 two component transcriptional regulator, LytTR family [Cnuella takakiae]
MEQKVVLVDDEVPARSLLKEYLQAYPQLKVVAECKNGIEAIGIINVLQPDLVFLDIQMPGKTGLEVLQEIEHLPQIIFATAFDKYALDAFNANAVDYLLKPFTRERFDQALRKALQKEPSVMQNLMALSESLQGKTYPERILVEQGNKWITLPVVEIYWLEAEGDYTKIHTAKQSFLSSKGISELETRLNPQQFQRVHRSAIIALNAIREIHREPTGPQVVLQNGITVKVSRSYTDALRRLIY